MLDIIITSHEEDDLDRESYSNLQGCNVYYNEFQPSVNHARLLAIGTGTSEYMMWLDGDDDISFRFLQRFINELHELRPAIGLYSPMICRPLVGRSHVEICDLLVDITPKSTHMAFAFKRSYAKEQKDLFNEFIWGDYILRSKLLSEPCKYFLRSNSPRFYTWNQKLSSRSGRLYPKDSELEVMFKYVNSLKKKLIGETL